MAKSDAYKQLISKLPRLPNGADDTRYQAKVEETKKAIVEPQASDDFDKACDIDYCLNYVEKLMKDVHQALLRSAAGQRHASKFTEVWLTIRDIKDRMDAIDYNTNLIKAAYEQLMCDQLEVEGTSMHRLESGEGVTTYLEPYPKIIDPIAFMAYVRADPDLSNKLSLHSSTMRALCGDLLKNGYDVPPGIEVYSKPVVRKLS